MTDLLLTVLGIAVFFVGLAVSIALHEIGHLVPAKRFGVKVSQYMVGFGRTVWSRRRGETEYGLKAIPLGGFVRMVGMLPPEPGADPTKLRRISTGPFQALIDDARRASKEEIGPTDVDRVFYRKSWWKKLIIMLGGPAMNIIIAVVLALGVLMIHGVVDDSDSRQQPVIATVSECVIAAAEEARACTDADPAAPAAAAGLRPGDRILAWDGQAVDSWPEVRDLIRDTGAGSVTIEVQREIDGADQTLTLTADLIVSERPALDANGDVIAVDQVEEVGFLGVSPALVPLRQDVGASVAWIGGFVTDSVEALARVPARMVDIWNVAFNGAERGTDTPMSIVGAGRAGGEIAALDAPAADRIATFVMLLAGFNMAIALFNLIPLLPLDGGHAVGAIWEGIKRGWAKLTRRPAPRPVDVAKALPLAYGMATVLIGVSLLLIYVDIVAPIQLFG